jgi:hypothetical protein
MRIRLAAMVLIAATTVWAQDTKVQDPAQSKELNTRAYIQLLRADMKSKKEQIVKEAMQLNDQQAAIFWPIYREYDAAQTKLADEKLAIIADYAQNFATMNNEKAGEFGQRMMEHDERRMALREKYYGILKKSLPAILAVRFFQVENQIQLIVDLQIASNLPIIEAATTE